MLQRIDVGLALTTVAMVVAAIVEIKCLDVIKEHGLEDNPKVPVSVSAFWHLPQYIFGVAEIFVIISQIEFFYDQAPDDMQSIGTTLYTTNTAIGHFICTGIITIAVSVTSGKKGDWIVDYLNQCRIDKYYWLLATMDIINLVFCILVANWYTYKTAVWYHWGRKLWVSSECWSSKPSSFALDCFWYILKMFNISNEILILPETYEA